MILLFFVTCKEISMFDIFTKSRIYVNFLLQNIYENWYIDISKERLNIYQLKLTPLYTTIERFTIIRCKIKML